MRTGTKKNVELECSVLMAPLFLPSVRLDFTSLLRLPRLRMTAFNVFLDKLVFRKEFKLLAMTYVCPSAQNTSTQPFASDKSFVIPRGYSPMTTLNSVRIEFAIEWGAH